MNIKEEKKNYKKTFSIVWEYEAENLKFASFNDKKKFFLKI